VHRDLKPENIFIRSDQGVKILDFGLAKLQSALEGTNGEPTQTLSGVIVGTAGYMAPEQITNEPVDARADLFALGVMLYEMVAGRHPFRCASTFETLHAVLTTDPPDLSDVNEHLPAPLARIVLRLLAKAPDARFQSALDLVWALEQVGTGRASRASASALHNASIPRWRPQAAAWLAAPTLAAAVLVGGWQLMSDIPRDAGAPRLTQFTLPLPAGVFLASAPMVSPDGRRIAFTGTDGTNSRLFVRALAARNAIDVPGTEGASRPFWSPDGATLGFFARGQLMKVTWPGGATVGIAAAPQPYGGTWNPSGFILFAPDVILAGLHRVPATGGTAEAATLLDDANGDTAHWWPVFLPDGIHFLYHVRSTRDDRLGIYLGRLDRPASPSGLPLLRSPSNVVFVPPLPDSTEGVLLYVADGRIEARRFDTMRLSVAADAEALGLRAGDTTLYHPMLLTASSDVLAFAESGVPSGDRLEAVDRQGARLRLWETPEALNWPRLSPDGTRIALQRVDGLRNNPDIWVEDLGRQTRTRVTTAPSPDLQPVWSPDGRRIVYSSGPLPGRSGTRTLNIAAADGTGILRTFPCPAEYCEPTDWSTNGRLLINVRDARGWDVWSVSPDESEPVQPLLAERFSERDARFSPNGGWIVYTSTESGRSEVSARSVSGPSTRIVLSSDGGDQPFWRRDGAEVLFVEPNGHLQSVHVAWTRNGTPTFGLPTSLNVPPIGFGHWGTQYDVSNDGNQIYRLRRNEDPAPREIHVVMGWRALLDQGLRRAASQTTRRSRGYPSLEASTSFRVAK
jgi:Tol biopolymer transport system component